MLQMCKYFRSNYVAKMVNATFAYQKKNGRCKSLGKCGIYHVFHDCIIIVSIYICKEQICARPFCRPMGEMQMGSNSCTQIKVILTCLSAT